MFHCAIGDLASNGSRSMVIAKRFWHVQNFNETMELEGGAWATGKIVENYAKWVQFHSEAASFFKLSFHKLQVYVRKWYFVTKIVLWEKNCSSDREKKFEFRGWRPRICNIFEITRTIYSNSERSEQFLVTECFFNLFLEVSHKLEQLKFKLKKKYWDLEACRKS